MTIAQKNSFFIDFFVQLYEYREYLIQSVLRDLRNKYKRTFLGYLWTMIHPFAMMIVLAIVFSHIMKTPIENYAVFLFVGLLPWNYFNSTAMMSLTSIRANARLFGQIPVPKYIFIISIAASNLTNFLFALAPLLILMLCTGFHLHWSILAFPIMLLPLLFVIIGISLLLAASNVFFDDTLHLAEVGLSMLYFLSPILYRRDVLPEWLVQYLSLNPLFYQIEFIRGIFYDGTLPDLNSYLFNLGESAMILMLGLYVFKKVEDKFLYYI